jgi:hypothetical protein
MTERTESQGYYEMLWDCDHCGQKGLLGKSQRHCAECGAPQNPDKRYFPTPEQQKKIDGHSYEGSDRTCPACRAPMAAKAKNCTQCGSPMDGSAEVRGVAAPAPPPANKRRRIWPWVVGALVLIGVAIWLLFIRTKEAHVTVAAHRWERAIAIEQYADHQQSAWRDQVPNDASLPICARKERSTRKVADGEDCHVERHDKKDGTFEQVKKCTTKYRSEPVEDDWCTFTVRRWQKVDESKLAGVGTLAAWPDSAPGSNIAPVLGARRAGPRTEKLVLDLGGQTCEVSDAVWRKYTDGQQVKVEVRARSGEIVCSSL